jgi:ATP-binding cassette, subfamily B, heavy metal transporter
MASTKKYSSVKIVLQLIPYIWSPDWGMRLRVIASIILTLAMIALHISIPFIFKNIVNALSEPQSISYFYLVLLLVGYGVCWTLSQCIAQARALIIFRVLERGMRLLSLTIIDHLLALSMRFHVERRTGALANYINQAERGFDSIFWGLISFLIPTSLELLLVIVIISYLYGLIFGGILLSIMVVYLLFSTIAMNKTVHAQKLHNEIRAQASGHMIDSLLNFETIKSFNNDQYEHKEVDTLLKQREDAGTRRLVLETLVQFGQFAFIGIGLLIMTWVSGKAAYTGIITVGDFVLINGYLLQFAMPLNHFGYITRQVQKGIQDMKAIIDIVHLEPEIKDAPNAQDLKITQAEVTFNDVYFGYAPDRLILKGLSFNVPAGKTIAIVGPSGSGKSTIARLIFRFYDVTEGSIILNGYDIRSVTQDSLHKAVGIVPQDTVLFNNTLYYNIAYGNPHASKQEVEQAARLAHLHNFIISLPEGYETTVGERGLKLSGGEKQRVAIARLLLKKPALYIFDEATSSLDTQTEREIQNNLEEISAGATTIIIAHRLSTVIHAHEILVLDHGTIREHGTHTQLLEQQGLYAQLWTKQQQEKVCSENNL